MLDDITELDHVVSIAVMLLSKFNAPFYLSGWDIFLPVVLVSVSSRMNDWIKVRF
jgi:hypothetical protein